MSIRTFDEYYKTLRTDTLLGEANALAYALLDGLEDVYFDQRLGTFLWASLSAPELSKHRITDALAVLQRIIEEREQLLTQEKVQTLRDARKEVNDD